ncbi:MAG TPA: tyrosine-type recombinase/integrase, partial [Puia sp.]|nr:tyrosine-type recombinase/integrase [Puia sp.]
MNPVTQPFIDYLKFEKRYSAHTIRAYNDDLDQFFVFVDSSYGITPLDSVNTTFIRSWLAKLKEQKITSKSINRKISSLKSFFKYQLRTGSLTKSPMTGIISPKSGKRLPVYVEEKDMRLLTEQIDFPDTWQGRTERLLIRMFYNTGVRLSELVSLKNSQVDFPGATIRVVGKGNKERIIPVSSSLLEEIGLYQREKQGLPGSKNGKSGDTLLINEAGKALYVKYAYLSVRKWLSQVTTIDKKSPHVLRHSFATHLMNHGADLNSVKELLGHSSLAATQLYTHNTIDKLREVHKKSHPRG